MNGEDAVTFFRGELGSAYMNRILRRFLNVNELAEDERAQTLSQRLVRSTQFTNTKKQPKTNREANACEDQKPGQKRKPRRDSADGKKRVPTLFLWD